MMVLMVALAAQAGFPEQQVQQVLILIVVVA
jgi:hypothetical protein